MSLYVKVTDVQMNKPIHDISEMHQLICVDRLIIYHAQSEIPNPRWLIVNLKLGHATIMVTDEQSHPKYIVAIFT